MKIVFLSDDFPPQSFGGAGISTFELALGMKKAGHDVSVITTCRKKSEAGESEYSSLKIFKIATDYSEKWRAYVSLNNRPVIKEIEKILSEIKPEVVHANNIHQYLSYKALKIAKRYAKKVIWTARDTMAFSYGKLNTEKYLEKLDSRVSWLDNLRFARKRWNPFRNLIIRKYLSYADKRIAISHSLKQALLSNGIKDVEVIHNGIDFEEWRNIGLTEEFNKNHGLTGKKVILFGGRLSPAKGGDKAIEALALIVREMPDAALLCVGALDEYAESMQKKAEALDIREYIINTGWISRDEIKRAYEASYVVLMPSLYLDPFGRVNIEAMAAGKPVVGTCYGGTPEIIEDNVTGFVIDPRNAESIAAKMVELIKNPDKAKVFGEAGRARAIRLFSLSDKIKKYLELYGHHS